MASMKTKYGMATYVTCAHSWITNDQTYTACNEDHQRRPSKRGGKQGRCRSPLPQGETKGQAYIQKMLQGRRMGGPPEAESWAMGSGYRVKVYREAKDGAG